MSCLESFSIFFTPRTLSPSIGFAESVEWIVMETSWTTYILYNLSVTVVPGPVAVFCMVYHYTKRAMLTRLLGNVGPAIYVVL